MLEKIYIAHMMYGGLHPQVAFLLRSSSPIFVDTAGRVQGRLDDRRRVQ